jgi:type III pantothenate kinase
VESRTADEWAVLIRGLLGDREPEVSGIVVCASVPAVLQEWRRMLAGHFGGTATTFDVVNSQGQYVGGAISPGIEISLEALERRGAQLRMVELRRPRSVIARNTVEALQSGMVFGVASQVDGIVARIIDELGVTDDAEKPVTVVATGYLAPLVYDECRCFTIHDPWLTLHGLELVYARNRGGSAS